MKNPFKKSAIIDTVVNLAAGGLGNVAYDYAIAQVGVLDGQTTTVQNAIKAAVGAIAGTMISNKYARSAFDGIAVVAATDLIKEYVPTGSDNTGAGAKATEGLPQGTIGRVRHTGQRGFRKHVAGVAGADFMSC